MMSEDATQGTGTYRTGDYLVGYTDKERALEHINDSVRIDVDEELPYETLAVSGDSDTIERLTILPFIDHVEPETAVRLHE